MRDDKQKSPSLVNWLGFDSKLNLSNAVWLGPLIGLLLCLIVLILVAASFVTVGKFMLALFGVGVYQNDASGEAIRNTGLIMAALLGAPFIVWRSAVAAKQAQIADDSFFNDKINAAALELSSRRETTRVVQNEGTSAILREWDDDLMGRAAAIDRLEELANEKIEVAPRIVRLLSTYVRVNFSCNDLSPTEDIETRRTPRMDLQRAIDTIGRLYKVAVQVDRSSWRLDLKNCNFDGVSFAQGFFRAADFSNSRFEASVLDDGVFEGCIFRGSLLNHCRFFRANLKGAKLDRVTINRPEPQRGGFVASINMGVLDGVTLIAADISALDYIGEAEEVSKIFATSDTIISDSLTRSGLSENDLRRAHISRGAPQLSPENAELVSRLEESGFQHWLPYSSSDLSISHHLSKFYEELDMLEWPYWG